MPEGTDWCTYKYDKSKSMRMDQRVTVYWESLATGAPANGVSVGEKGHKRDYLVGDAMWPQRDENFDREPDDTDFDAKGAHYEGDTGAMFVVPARSLRATNSRSPEHSEARTAATEGYLSETAGSRLPRGWVVPVEITLKSGNRGPFYLRVRTASDLTLLNPSPAYSFANTGAPWVDVYNDTAERADPDATSGRLAEADKNDRYVYVVVDRKPKRGELSFQLDAAPDGMGDYVASTGNMAGTAAPTKGRLNWGKLARKALGCLPNSGEEWDTFALREQDGDVDHDGVDDHIVITSCPTNTSSNPDRALVYNGITLDQSAPDLMGILGTNDDYFRGLTVKVGDGSVTTSGPSVGPDETRAGPSRTLTIRYEWTGASFKVVDRKSSPLDKPRRLSAFVTPSGNITCGLLDGNTVAGCFITEHDFSLSCSESTPVLAVVSSTGEGHISGCCGSTRGELTRPAKVGYGKTVNFDVAKCQVTAAGVTCTNGEQHGFFLSRQSHREF